ncbi:MAG: TonB-dependent receptor plug domain-containing protein, partial [Myxococcaceae bacterium]
MARADARLEARRHFQTGMSLIEGKDFDTGIAHLKRAYEIKPHANVLYNIGHAYQDAGDTPNALEFYKLYLETNPLDADTVRATVEKLENALPKPTPPPPPPPITVEKERKPSKKEVRQKELEDARRAKEISDRLEAAAKEAQARRRDADDAPDTEDDTAGMAPYEEVVVTASRRAQSSLEAPNATTIITGDEIRLSGATSLVDLLRRVPGADVMVMGVGSANVSFRGF